MELSRDSKQKMEFKSAGDFYKYWAELGLCECAGGKRKKSVKNCPECSVWIKEFTTKYLKISEKLVGLIAFKHKKSDKDYDVDFLCA